MAVVQIREAVLRGERRVGIADILETQIPHQLKPRPARVDDDVDAPGIEHFEELLADKEKAGGSGDLAEPVTSSDPQIEALATLCQALLSSSEFLYVD